MGFSPMTESKSRASVRLCHGFGCEAPKGISGRDSLSHRVLIATVLADRLMLASPYRFEEV